MMRIALQVEGKNEISLLSVYFLDQGLCLFFFHMKLFVHRCCFDFLIFLLPGLWVNPPASGAEKPPYLGGKAKPSV